MERLKLLLVVFCLNFVENVLMLLLHFALIVLYIYEKNLDAALFVCISGTFCILLKIKETLHDIEIAGWSRATKMAMSGWVEALCALENHKASKSKVPVTIEENPVTFQEVLMDLQNLDKGVDRETK